MSGDPWPYQAPYPYYQYYNWPNLQTSQHINFGFSEKTLRFAHYITAMPPPSNDQKEIEEWAKRLAADLCRFTD